MLRFLRIATVFTLGAVLGPIMIAAFGAAAPPKHMPVLSAKEVEVGKLVEAYRARLPRGRLFLTIASPPDGAECGYEPETVFPGRMDAIGESQESDAWSDYEGYLALHSWRSDREGEEFITAVQDRMNDTMTRFEAGFLRRCIESTVASRFCSARIKAIGKTVERFDPKRRNFALAGGHEDRVVCTFVDGIAARKGLKLVPLLVHPPFPVLASPRARHSAGL